MTIQHQTRTERRHPEPTWRPATFPLADDDADTWPADDERAREAAVDHAHAVLESGWHRWVGRAGLDPVPALRCSAPRVTVVGEHPDEYHLVALIRFSFIAEGVAFRGCARGPIDAPYFAVQRESGAADPGAATHRRWWRRRDR